MCRPDVLELDLLLTECSMCSSSSELYFRFLHRLLTTSVRLRPLSPFCHLPLVSCLASLYVFVHACVCARVCVCVLLGYLSRRAGELIEGTEVPVLSCQVSSQ